MEIPPLYIHHERSGVCKQPIYPLPRRTRQRPQRGREGEGEGVAIFAPYQRSIETLLLYIHLGARSVCGELSNQVQRLFKHTLHKAFSTANICAGGCSMPTPLSQYIHQNTAQCPDVSGNIPVAGRWCSRSSRAATADTAAESIFLPPAPPPTPCAAAPLRRRFLPRWRSLCLPLFTQSGSLKRPA